MARSIAITVALVGLASVASAQPYTTFTRSGAPATIGEPSPSLALGDWDLDGDIDVAFSAPGIDVAFNNGGLLSSIVVPCTDPDYCPEATGSYQSLFPIDLNNDGFLDLAGSSLTAAAPGRGIGAFYTFGVTGATYHGAFVGSASPAFVQAKPTGFPATCASVPGVMTVTGSQGTATVLSITDIEGNPLPGGGVDIQSGQSFIVFGSDFGPGCRLSFVKPSVPPPCYGMALEPVTLPDGKQGQAYIARLQASGGIAPYNFAVTTGALPPGLSLLGDTISGVPSSPAVSGFTITATGNGGCTVSRNYAIAVNGGSCTTSIALGPRFAPSGWVGEPYNFQLAASGGVPSYFFALQSGALPPGLGINASGMIGGVPSAPGIYSFSISAADGMGCAGTRTFDIAIGPLTPTPPMPATVISSADDIIVAIAPDHGTTDLTDVDLLVEPLGNVPQVYDANLVLRETGGSSPPPPFVTAAFPAWGCPGEEVLITGANFTNVADTVVLDGEQGLDWMTIISWSDTEIRGYFPSPSSGNVTVSVGGRVSDPFYFAVPEPGAPTISLGAGPNAADGSQTIDIDAVGGSVFGVDQGIVYVKDTVTQQSAIADIEMWNDVNILVKVPAILGAGSSTLDFWVQPWYGCRSSATPFDISSVRPRVTYAQNTCPSGTDVIEILGADFGPPGPIAKVTIGTTNISSTNAGVVWTPTSITLAPPGSVTSGFLTVTRQDTLTSNAVPFEARIDIRDIDGDGRAMDPPWGIENLTTTTFEGGPFCSGSCNPAGTVEWNGHAAAIAGGGSYKSLSATIPASAREIEGRSAIGITLDMFGTKAVVAGDDTYGGVRALAVMPTGELFDAPAGLPSSGMGYDVAGGDTSGDGVDEVFTMQPGNGIGLWLNDGFGNFAYTPPLASGLPSSGTFERVRLVDLNFDTAPDLLAINAGTGRVQLALGAGPSSFAPFQDVDAAQPDVAIDFAVGDFDSDGNEDVAYLHAGGFRTYVGSLGSGGSYTFETDFSFSEGWFGVQALRAADMNDDGVDDLVVSRAQGAAGVLDVFLGAGETHIAGLFDASVIPADACPGIGLSPATLPDGTLSAPYSQFVSPSGGTSPYTFALTAGTLPVGLTLNGVSGEISGTPTVPGTRTFTVTATDSVGCSGSRTYDLTIDCPITLSPPSLPNGTVGTPYSQTISASGGTPPYTFAVTEGALPAGLTLIGGSGQLSGTPTAPGNRTFTITATDAAGCTGSLSYTVAVNCPPIALTPGPLPSGTVGVPYSYTLTAGGGTAPYTYTLIGGALPNGLTLGTSTGIISGTPTTAGSSSFTVMAVDSRGCSGFSNYNLDVCAAIAIGPASLPAGTVGTAYSETVTASGGTSPYSFYVTSGTLPPGLFLYGGTGEISGTPTTRTTANFTITANDVAGCSGSRSYVLDIDCGGTITLSPGSPLPSGTVGVSYNRTISASGGAGPYTYAVTSGTLPPGLTLNTGVIVGTPTTPGTSNFTITATDSQGCTGSQNYDLTINCPTITLSPVVLPSGTVGTFYSQTVTASGGTSPYSYAVTSGSLPPGLSLDTDTGIISGTPVNPPGTHSFTITATDVTSCTGFQSYSLTIN